MCFKAVLKSVGANFSVKDLAFAMKPVPISQLFSETLLRTCIAHYFLHSFLS